MFVNEKIIDGLYSRKLPCKGPENARNWGRPLPQNEAAERIPVADSTVSLPDLMPHYRVVSRHDISPQRDEIVVAGVQFDRDLFVLVE